MLKITFQNSPEDIPWYAKLLNLEKRAEEILLRIICSFFPLGFWRDGE